MTEQPDLADVICPLCGQANPPPRRTCGRCRAALPVDNDGDLLTDRLPPRPAVGHYADPRGSSLRADHSGGPIPWSTHSRTQPPMPDSTIPAPDNGAGTSSLPDSAPVSGSALPDGASPGAGALAASPVPAPEEAAPPGRSSPLLGGALSPHEPAALDADLADGPPTVDPRASSEDQTVDRWRRALLVGVVAVVVMLAVLIGAVTWGVGRSDALGHRTRQLTRATANLVATEANLSLEQRRYKAEDTTLQTVNKEYAATAAKLAELQAQLQELQAQLEQTRGT